MVPLLYLHGLASGDVVPALEQFLGSAAGLSALDGLGDGQATAYPAGEVRAVLPDRVPLARSVPPRPKRARRSDMPS